MEALTMEGISIIGAILILGLWGKRKLRKWQERKRRELRDLQITALMAYKYPISTIGALPEAKHPLDSVPYDVRIVRK
jgi:hypothetical protein